LQGEAKLAEHSLPAPAKKTARTLNLKRYVPFFLRATANKTSRTTARIYQEFFGISMAEWRVMSMLAIEPNITAKRVCEVRSLDAAAVSRSIRIMEQRGDVHTSVDAADGRQQRLMLTPQGQELHDRVVEMALQIERKFLVGFTSKEVEALISFLSRLHENVSALATKIDQTGVFPDSPEPEADENAGQDDHDGVPLKLDTPRSAGPLDSDSPEAADKMSADSSRAGRKDFVETLVSNGRLHIRADVGLDGIKQVQQMLGKYEELLRIMAQ
jgi:DNA-binding MarR family transcriptional regulator